jgi:hypothetical protein
LNGRKKEGKMKFQIVLIIFVLILLAGCKQKIPDKIIIDTNQPNETLKESVNSTKNNSQNSKIDIVVKENITNNEVPQNITINTSDNSNQNIIVNITNNQSTITPGGTDNGNDGSTTTKKHNPASCKDEVTDNADNELCTNLIYGLNCISPAEISLADKTIILTVENNLNFNIIFIPSKPYVEENPLDCMTDCIVSGTQISTDGIDYVDVKQYPKITNNTEFYVKITCSELDNGYIDQYFPLSYNGEVVDTGVDDLFRIKAVARIR